MDGLREPVGAQPPEVYWRRRIVTVVGVVLLLVVVYFLVSSPGGGDSTAKPAVTPDPAVTTDSTTGAPAEIDVSRPCTAADVTLTTSPNPFSFATGALPIFDVSITQSGTTPCMLDTSAPDTEFVVWSGGESNKDIYYSTAYCPDDATINARTMILEPGDDEPFQVTWSRQRVGADCTPGADPDPGFYWAQLTIQGIASEPAQFQLEG
jgi:hypothetical protein